MMKSRLLCLTLITLFLTTLLMPAQAQIVENTRLEVQDWLKTTLGREFSVVEYNFEGATWESDALGCPQAGMTYTEGDIPGYRWSFVLDDGLRYAVHSNLDGSQVALCTDLSALAANYSWFNGEAFTIKYPGNWSASIVSDVEVRFTYRGLDNCTLPGMRVMVHSDYAEAVEALQIEGSADAVETPLGEYLTSEAQGKTLTFSTTCDDRERRWRASALQTESGAGISVLQWSPAITGSVWDNVFRDMLGSFISNLTIPPTPDAAAVFAEMPQVPNDPAIDLTTIPLVHVFVGDLHVGRINELPGKMVSFDGSLERNQMKVAPLTGRLAYVESGSKLYMIESVEIGSHNLITDQLSILPPAWSPDGEQLAFAVTGDAADQLLVKSRLPDGTLQDTGSLTLDTSCTIISPYDVDQLYWRETGPNGNALTFEWLAEGRFLVSTSCNGVGLGIWTPVENTITEIGADLRRGTLSPDRAQLAAVSDDGLVLINLETLEAQTITTELPPDQLAWDASGTQLFYSTLIPQDSIIWDNAETQANAEQLLGVFPFESRLNTIRIYQLDLSTRTEVQRWEGSGFAIGSIEVAPGGSGLLFSLIPSDRTLLSNFTNNEAVSKVVNSIPETQLYWLPLAVPTDGSSINLHDNGGAQLLAVTAQPLFVR